MRFLLLRGFGREKQHWGNFPNQLADKTNCKVLCIDLPGFGTEEKRLSPPHVKWIIQDLRHRYLKTESSEKTIVVGHSLGGMIAMHWAAEFKTDFSGVIALNPSFRNLSSPHQRLKPKSLIKFLQITRTNSIRRRESLVLDMVSNLRNKNKEQIKEWTKVSEGADFNFINLTSQLLAGAICKPPQKIDIPLLLLASQKDNMVSVDCSSNIAKSFGCPISYHPEAGHDIVVDDKDWVLDKLNSFKDKLQSNRSATL